jgi:hypothetical protein
MDTENTQKQYEKVPQVVAILCSERPKESKTRDLEKEPAKAQLQGSIKNRVRYSGAARRKHKKQLQKEAGEGPIQANTQETDAAAHSLTTEKGGPSTVVKRPRSGLSIPRPSGAQQKKRPKVPEQRTYAQATSNLIRVAIVPMAYPDRNFEDEEIVLLKRSIKGRILDLVKGTTAPIFQDGAVLTVLMKRL